MELHIVASLAVWLHAMFVSLSLDFTQLIDIAFDIINNLWPLFVVPMGFLFGLRLIGWIMDEIRTAIPGR